MAAQLGPMSQPWATGMAEVDAMDIDIDIDMDADVDPIPEPELEEGEEYEATPFNPPIPDTLVPAIYTEDPEQEIQPAKVHIRGIDDLSTDEVRNFAMEHFSTPPTYVQWIDDTSANLVYSSSDIALEALLSLSAIPPTKSELLNNPLRLRETKPRSGFPFQARRAIAGDRKRRNAKEASRYYLLHPEADPVERMRKEFANGRNNRRNGSDHGDYQRRRYDDREHRRRRDQDANGEQEGGDFTASMYDDDAESAGPSRSRGRGGRRGARNRSASPGRSITNSDEIVLDDASGSENDNHAASHRPTTKNNSRFRNRSPPPRYNLDDPHPYPEANRDKELFPSNAGSTDSKSGQLASDSIRTPTKTDRAVAAAKLKRELFPHRTERSNHRRSDAMDARSKADESNAEELARRMGKRMDINDTYRNEDSGHVIDRKANVGKELFSSSSASTANASSFFGNHETEANIGLSIRGSAGLSIRGGAGLSIKGTAESTPNVRELFPDKYVRGGKGNEGKELFSDKIKGRGEVRRRKAEDLFG